MNHTGKTAQANDDAAADESRRTRARETIRVHGDSDALAADVALMTGWPEHYVRMICGTRDHGVK